MQVANAFLGISNLSMHSGKNITVVDKDIDVFDDQAVEWRWLTGLMRRWGQ